MDFLQENMKKLPKNLDFLSISSKFFNDKQATCPACSTVKKYLQKSIGKAEKSRKMQPNQ